MQNKFFYTSKKCTTIKYYFDSCKNCEYKLKIYKVYLQLKVKFPVFILKLTCNQNHTRNQTRIQGGFGVQTPLK